MPSVNDLTELESVETGATSVAPIPGRLNMLSVFRMALVRAGIRDRYLIGGAIVFGVGVSATAFFLKDYLFDTGNLDSLGYLGVFIFSFLGAATIFLPSGGSIVVIGAGAILNPVAVGVLAGTASALGEMTGYIVGYEGGTVLERRTKLYVKARRWMERHGSTTIFVLSLFPNPFFDAAGIAAGGIRFPLHKFLLLAWVGKTIQALAGAFVGALGSAWLVNLAEKFVD